MLVAALRSQITDLTSQVTSLNSKLVSSYTRIGDLDDDLHDRTDEVSHFKLRVAELERSKESWEREIEVGGWVERVCRCQTRAWAKLIAVAGTRTTSRRRCVGS